MGPTHLGTTRSSGHVRIACSPCDCDFKVRGLSHAAHSGPCSHLASQLRTVAGTPIDISPMITRAVGDTSIMPASELAHAAAAHIGIPVGAVRLAFNQTTVIVIVDSQAWSRVLLPDSDLLKEVNPFCNRCQVCGTSGEYEDLACVVCGPASGICPACSIRWQPATPPSCKYLEHNGSYAPLGSPIRQDSLVCYLCACDALDDFAVWAPCNVMAMLRLTCSAYEMINSRKAEPRCAC